MSELTSERFKNDQTSDGPMLEKRRFIEFSLGAEDYVIPLLMVKEVISVPDTVPIPKAPAHFVGIMNLRGQVITIVDIRKKLGIKPLDRRSEEAVIIVDISGSLIGIIVDAINKVLVFSLSEVNELPKEETQMNAKYIMGVYRKEKSITTLIDLPKVLE